MKVLSPLHSPFRISPNVSLKSSTKKSSSEPALKYGAYFKGIQEFFLKNLSLQKKSITVQQANDFANIKTEEVGIKTLKTSAEGLFCEKTASKSVLEEKVTDVKQSEKVDLDYALPFDPKAIVKTLDNGFTYYIRSNAYPSKETASLRLVVRAGSTDEQEHERGLAHFLEHLLFETENFGKQEIKSFFESKGAAFGADQNAYTSYNETVYKFDIPLNDKELMDKALLILREMATKAKISSSWVEEERSVILDEISDETAAHRYREKRDKTLLEGTPYPERRPAGLSKVIRECTTEQIRAFYERTYLPQNMALVAVGDFDSVEVEKLIQKHFSDIATSSLLPLKHEFKPLERIEPQFICHSDPECTTSILQVHYPLETDFEIKEATLGGVYQSVVNTLYQTMFNRRLAEIITDSESPPFIYAKGSKDEVMDNISYYRLTIAANDGEIPSAYKRLLIELKRVQEHGFLPQEFESAKKALKSQLEQLEKEKNVSNKKLASDYVAHFSSGSPAVDVTKVIDLKKSLLDLVKLEKINVWNKCLTADKGVVISLFIPSSVADTVSLEILSKIKEDVLAESVEPYKNSFVDRPLLRNVPIPGKIIETTVFEKIGTTKLTLENGMNVYIRPSTQKEDSILMYASSSGDKLSVPVEKRAAVNMAIELYARSGQAGLTLSQLKNVLNGKSVAQEIIIGNYLSSLLTTSSKKDLETAFQLFHIAYTDRAFRKEVFNTLKKENVNAAKHQNNDPESYYESVGNALCTQNHPQFLPITAEEYEKAEYDDAVEFLDRQFKNPGNFDLVITGNVDAETLKPLIEEYLAGVPKQGERPDYNSSPFPGYEFPSDIVVKEVEAGIASPCQTHISFPAPANDDRKSRQFGLWTAGILSMHLCDLLRFDKAESYHVECNYALTTLRGQEAKDPSSMELEISGLPENIRDISDKVLKEIKRLQTEGFTSEKLSSYKVLVKEMYRKALDIDSVWLSLIASHARWKWDMDTIVEDFNQSIEEFDEKILQEYIQKLFPLNRYVQTTLLPKKEVALQIENKED